jgi:2-keto-4-pentenoate hydratase/2-oxohepta-3-ene-1,7-dioic acid hydratase in catechol pathway
MKIALFNDFNLGIAKDDRIFDVSDIVNWNTKDPQRSLLRLMENFGELKDKINSSLFSAQSYPLSEVKLQPPVPKPGKIVAAPVNYFLHQSEMNDQFGNAEFTIDKLGFFLKAPTSIIGHGDTIRLPYKDRRIDHEAELAFVVGKKAKNVPAAEASKYIFGYFGLMDITIRGEEDRPWRKSFDTFTPIGPWIVTGDEIDDPNELGFRLWVNNELRQSANTKDLIYNCYEFFQAASEAMTLEPGDIITTGTPEGVGPIREGDQVHIQLDQIGEFTVHVANKLE